MNVRLVHRCIALCTAALWLFQIATGLSLVFWPEIDDASVRGTHEPLSTGAIASRIESIHGRGGDVESVWVANHSATRFSIYYRDADGVSRAMRVDGAGRVLRDGIKGSFGNGGNFQTLAVLHQSLYAGATGRWLLTLSGLLLMVNLSLGMKLAWQKGMTWRRALLPTAVRGRKARLCSIHRALGFWVFLPALCLVIAGLGLLHRGALERMVGIGAPSTQAVLQSRSVDVSRALAAALAEFPGSKLSAFVLPRDASPWYRIRLNGAEESSRLYGATTLYLSAVDARVLQRYDPTSGFTARSVVDGLVPFHTGALGGLTGRIALVLVGCSLVALIVFGLRLWLARREPRSP